MWCGQAGKHPSPTEDPTDPAANDYRLYYPGNDYVYEVGCDMYVGGTQKGIEDKFISLNDFYTKAQTHGKPFAIPEWSIIKSDTTPELHDDWVEMIAKWMEAEERT